MGILKEQKSTSQNNDLHSNITGNNDVPENHIFVATINELENNELNSETSETTPVLKLIELPGIEKDFEADCRKPYEYEKKKNYFEDSDDSIRDPIYENSSDDEETETRPRNTNSGDNKYQKEVTTPKGKKKRRKQEANWKINVQKHIVTSGEEHPAKIKILRAKELGNPCKEGCYLKCFQNINAETRSSIYSMFWNSLNDVNRKRQYVASHVKTELIIRRRSRSGLRCDAKNHTRQYDFESPDNDTCDSCDSFLIKIHDAEFSEEKSKLQEEYDKHLAEASKGYDLKRKDKEYSGTQNNYYYGLS
ncbi:unnamed protein product [Psylliodes chrysocephalus]|uniref:Uncharacterized protein n=1 Tax=Psylliodes chrysocephalus TaxID=3402493 RepID=A0A9P0G4N4_9CUCU|nr:unnamed protein product [Psylliodes chrysocephala]